MAAVCTIGEDDELRVLTYVFFYFLSRETVAEFIKTPHVFFSLCGVGHAVTGGCILSQLFPHLAAGVCWHGPCGFCCFTF